MTSAIDIRYASSMVHRDTDFHAAIAERRGIILHTISGLPPAYSDEIIATRGIHAGGEASVAGHQIFYLLELMRDGPSRVNGGVRTISTQELRDGGLDPIKAAIKARGVARWMGNTDAMAWKRSDHHRSAQKWNEEAERLRQEREEAIAALDLSE